MARNMPEGLIIAAAIRLGSPPGASELEVLSTDKRGASGAGFEVAAAHRRGCGPGDRERFVHNAPNGARAASALRAATQAMVDLPGRARNVLPRRQRRTHIVVGENVARAHDH